MPSLLFLVIFLSNQTCSYYQYFVRKQMIAIFHKSMAYVFLTISNVFRTEHLEHGSNTAKIIILVRDKEIYMNNLYVLSYHVNIKTLYILHNGYIEFILRLMLNLMSVFLFQHHSGLPFYAQSDRVYLPLLPMPISFFLFHNSTMRLGQA